MMGLRTSLAFGGLLMMPLAAHADGMGLQGDWARDDGSTRIAISQCGPAFCAVNTWVKASDGKEKIGDRLILKLQPVSGRELQGQAYDVRRQMNFTMTIMLQAGSMTTSGCVLFGIICKDAGWTRIN